MHLIPAKAHVRVTGENEAGVDLVLIQPFLLYCVKNVFLMLTSIFKHNFHEEEERSLSQNKFDLSLTSFQRLGY